MGNPKSKIIRRPGEKVSKNLKKSAWSAAFESLAMVILGILFVIWPDTMVRILAYVVGAFFIIKGAYGIVMYYTEKGPKAYFDSNLLTAVICLLIGIASFLIGEDIANVLRVIVGIIIIYESLVRISTASKMQSANVEFGKYMLALAIIMLILGVFITFNTGAVFTLIGWVMILSGVIAIVGDVVFIKHVNTIMDKLSGKK